MSKTILLIEDNMQVNEFNKRLLEKQGFFVEMATTLMDARKLLEKKSPDAIVLDIGLPDGNGIEFLSEFRKKSRVPVLLLTGNGKNDDVELGFENGCNDYLPKPYKFGVLLARLNNMIQSVEQIPEKITKGSLLLKSVPMVAYLHGEDLLLSQKEFSLLLLFIQNENDILSSEYLHEQIWGNPMVGDDNVVKVTVSRLRNKLDGSKHTITSKRGKGYIFEEEM